MKLLSKGWVKIAEMVKAKLNGEYEIILPKHRADREEWYTEKGWEKKRLYSMYARLYGPGSAPGVPLVADVQDVIYYIGAEEGEMAALCQMWGAKVVLFEPNPKVWSTIKAIWEANNLDHPAGIYAGFASDVSEIALSPVEQMDQDLYSWPPFVNREIVAAHGFKELDKEGSSYDQIRIDDFVEVTKIVPTAISLDVEGAEGRVLRGAELTLKEFHPKIWLSGHPEFLHDNFNGGGGFSYLRELRDWLKKELGYKEEILDYDHEVHLFYEYK